MLIHSSLFMSLRLFHRDHSNIDAEADELLMSTFGEHIREYDDEDREEEEERERER